MIEKLLTGTLNLKPNNNITGAFGYEWLLGQIRILAGTSPFRVVFEAQVGENTNRFPRSYIAIDDIDVKTRSCTDLRGIRFCYSLIFICM